MKKKAVLYTRVSSDKDSQKMSIINQREIYTEYCEQMGYELVDIYAEVGSGTSSRKRQEFKRLLFDGGVDVILNPRGNDIFNESDRKPLYDIVICKDTSRWSRSASDGKAAVERLLAKGVHTVFANSGVSTFDEGWQFTLGILFTIAQNESQNTSKRVKLTKKHNSKKQIYQPGAVCYGYIRNEQNEIVIHEEQAKVVRYIYKRYLEVGSHIISKELNEMNVLTQRNHKWSPDKVTRLIQLKTMAGSPIVNRSSKNSVTDTRRTKNDPKDFIEIKNAVDAIVTVEEWEEVNRIRESRINKNKRIGRKPARNDLYYEKLYCSCGSRMVRHIGDGDKINYICQSRRKNYGCVVRGISIKNLSKIMDEADISSLRNAMGDSIYYNELLSKLENQKNHLNTIKQDINNQIKQLDNEIDEIADQYIPLKDGDKFKDRLKKKADNKEAEISELKLQLDKLNIETIDKIKAKVNKKKDMIDTLAKVKNLTIEDKITLLNKVIIGDNDLEYIFAIPSYEEEVDEYNKLFSMNPINLSIPFSPFTNSFRRTHKSAREYWNEFDEQSMESEEYDEENPMTDEDYNIQQEEIKRAIDLITKS